MYRVLVPLSPLVLSPASPGQGLGHPPSTPWGLGPVLQCPSKAGNQEQFDGGAIYIHGGRGNPAAFNTSSKGAG